MIDPSKLYDLLAGQPEGEWTIEELARLLKVSKTAVRKALVTLESDGAIALLKEEG